MEIELRGKKWEQITKEKYLDSIGEKTAMFKDDFYGEKTYFQLNNAQAKETAEVKG